MFNLYQPTRSLRYENQMLLLPPKNTKSCDKDIAIRGCYYWNDLPGNIKAADSIDCFKTYLKVYGQDIITTS